MSGPGISDRTRNWDESMEVESGNVVNVVISVIWCESMHGVLLFQSVCGFLQIVLCVCVCVCMREREERERCRGL